MVTFNLTNPHIETLQAFFASFFYGKRKANDMIIRGKVLVNQTIGTFQTKLEVGDQIELDFEEDIPSLQKTYKLPKILYEDDDLLAVRKDSGILIYDLVNPTLDTLDNRVAMYYKTKGIASTVRHLHRLDKETSGLILYAKNPLAHSYLNEMWDSYEVRKFYLGIVRDHMKYNQKTATFPIGSHRHKNNVYVVTPQGKYAATKYNVLRNYKDYSLVEFELLTGRTHQIRVHMSFLENPILGDEIYGKKDASRLMLHSYKMVLPHPRTKETLEITCPLDDSMQAYL